MEHDERLERRPRRSFTEAFKAEVVGLVRQLGNTAASSLRRLPVPTPSENRP
jgi:hypothetical protein